MQFFDSFKLFEVHSSIPQEFMFNPYLKQTHASLLNNVIGLGDVTHPFTLIWQKNSSAETKKAIFSPGGFAGSHRIFFEIF